MKIEINLTEEEVEALKSFDAADFAADHENCFSFEDWQAGAARAVLSGVILQVIEAHKREEEAKIERAKFEEYRCQAIAEESRQRRL